MCVVFMCTYGMSVLLVCVISSGGGVMTICGGLSGVGGILGVPVLGVVVIVLGVRVVCFSA